ncbi:MAG: ATPase domain-containing protein [Chthoniobacterales bacterium]
MISSPAGIGQTRAKKKRFNQTTLSADYPVAFAVSKRIILARMNESTPTMAPRCITGVAGLDDILGGGLPCNRLYLIEGHPGTGKTTFSLHFLLAGVRNGERVLYITLSETREELLEVAMSHGWNLDGIEILELSAMEAQLSASAQNTLFHSSEVELTQTTQVFLDTIARVQPSRVVFDSLSEFRLLAQSPLRYRRQILALKQHFIGLNCTTLLLDDGSAEGIDPQVQSLAHGVIELEQVAPEYGSDRRRLRVLKVRGSKYRGGYHDFAIQTGGIVVYPRLVASEHRRDYAHENVTSGLEGLDALLGGGLTRGTSTLFIGPAGTGKSTIGLKFLMQAAERGEKGVLYTFDETIGTVMTRADNLGFKLEAFIRKGLIEVHQIDPAEKSAGEFAFQIRHAVEENNVRMLLIDSLNGYLHSMGGERSLSLQMHELVTFLNHLGVVSMMTLAPHGMLGPMRPPVDVTYLADTVLALRYYEADGAVHKAISVIKKRTGTHEATIREVVVGYRHITIGRPLTDFRGIFTGTPQPERPARKSGAREDEQA